MSDKIFIDGMLARKPNDGAPEFIKATLRINVLELQAFLGKQTDEWITIDVKESKAGKWYAEQNTWKKDEKSAEAKAAQADIDPDSIPF